MKAYRRRGDSPWWVIVLAVLGFIVALSVTIETVHGRRYELPANDECSQREDDCADPENP